MPGKYTRKATRILAEQPTTHEQELILPTDPDLDTMEWMQDWSRPDRDRLPVMSSHELYGRSVGMSIISPPGNVKASDRVRPGWSRSDEAYFGQDRSEREAERKRTGTSTYQDVEVQRVPSGKRK